MLELKSVLITVVLFVGLRLLLFSDSCSKDRASSDGLTALSWTREDLLMIS